MQKIDKFSSLADRIIDLSADFRLKKAEAYRQWYAVEHTRPDMLNEFVYGNVELHDRRYEVDILVGAEESLDPQFQQMLPLVAAPEGDDYRISVEGDF